MIISFVIPAYNASRTIKRTLDSIFCSSIPSAWKVEVVVVDDGSSDGDVLRAIIDNTKYTNVSVISHKENKGMCAARNSGISETEGDVVIILDADDELVSNWPSVLQKIYHEWPKKSKVCFASCRNHKGNVTSEEPRFSGLLTLEDILNERRSGEYLPIFRGWYVREKPYVDLGLRKSCGIISYIHWATDAPIWVSNKVMRIYYDDRAGAVSHGWMESEKARETLQCYRALFSRYDWMYKKMAPKVYKTKILRMAVYMKFAGIPGAWGVWKEGCSFLALKETIGCAFVLMLEVRMARVLVGWIKRFGLIRKYG